MTSGSTIYHAGTDAELLMSKQQSNLKEKNTLLISEDTDLLIQSAIMVNRILIMSKDQEEVKPVWCKGPHHIQVVTRCLARMCVIISTSYILYLDSGYPTGMEGN